jgi:hypothetical protein
MISAFVAFKNGRRMLRSNAKSRNSAIVLFSTGYIDGEREGDQKS